MYYFARADVVNIVLFLLLCMFAGVMIGFSIQCDRYVAYITQRKKWQDFVDWKEKQKKTYKVRF